MKGEWLPRRVLKKLCCLSTQLSASVDRRLKLQKRRQYFIRVHNETLSAVAMRQQSGLSALSVNRWIQTSRSSSKNVVSFSIRTHNEALSVAMRVSNPDC